MIIRPAQIADRDALAPLRHALWPSGSIDEHASELDKLLNASNGQAFGILPDHILAAVSDDGVVCGFAEVSLRSRADGCDPAHNVGYLEGWYVAPDMRRHGVGAELVRAAEDWARSHGCREFASDTWLDNETSQRAHEALGFEVVDRCVHYRKEL
jgi:aminoglycoside 6'-N-acetyltransferase I